MKVGKRFLARKSRNDGPESAILYIHNWLGPRFLAQTFGSKVNLKHRPEIT